LSAALLTASFYFHEEMEQRFKKENARFLDVSRQYLSVDVEEKVINELYPRFVELYRHGVIGREQRLDWLEVLKQIGATSKLPSMSYEISSRGPYTPEFPVDTGSFQIYASPMRLNLGMLHENDLARVLATLDRDAPGIYTVKECELRSAHKKIEPDPAKQNITADCSLLWFTINLSNGADIVVR
jgi:hypothetical protein